MKKDTNLTALTSGMLAQQLSALEERVGSCEYRMSKKQESISHNALEIDHLASEIRLLNSKLKEDEGTIIYRGARMYFGGKTGPRLIIDYDKDNNKLGITIGSKFISLSPERWHELRDMEMKRDLEESSKIKA